MQNDICLAILLSIPIALASCATGGEHAREERLYRTVDWENRYRDYTFRCRQAGGHMLIRSVSRVARAGLPRRNDRYRCSLSIGPIPRD